MNLKKCYKKNFQNNKAAAKHLNNINFQRNDIELMAKSRVIYDLSIIMIIEFLIYNRIPKKE